MTSQICSRCSWLHEHQGYRQDSCAVVCACEDACASCGDADAPGCTSIRCIRRSRELSPCAASVRACRNENQTCVYHTTDTIAAYVAEPASAPSRWLARSAEAVHISTYIRCGYIRGGWHNQQRLASVRTHVCTLYFLYHGTLYFWYHGHHCSLHPNTRTHAAPGEHESCSRRAVACTLGVP